MAESMTPAEVSLLGMEVILAYRIFWKEYEEFEDMKTEAGGAMTAELLTKQRQVDKVRNEYGVLLRQFVDNAKNVPKPNIH